MSIISCRRTNIYGKFVNIFIAKNEMKTTLNYHDNEFLAYFAECFYAAYCLENFKLRTAHKLLA